MATMKPITVERQEKYTLTDSKGKIVWTCPAPKKVKKAKIVNGHLNMSEVIGVMTTVLYNIKDDYEEYNDLYDFSFGFATDKADLPNDNYACMRDVIQSLMSERMSYFCPTMMDTRITFRSKRHLFAADDDGYTYCLKIHCDGESKFIFKVLIFDENNYEFIDDVWHKVFSFVIDTNRDYGEFFDLIRYEGTDDEWNEVVD